MKHHEAIAEMLKNRKINSKDTRELELGSSFKEDSVELVESQEDIELEDSIDEDIGLDEVDNLTPEEIEREKRILARWEREQSVDTKRCPVCNSSLINVGNGIWKCEKINCYYSYTTKPKFKSKLSDSQIYERSFWG